MVYFFRCPQISIVNLWWDKMIKPTKEWYKIKTYLSLRIRVSFPLSLKTHDRRAYVKKTMQHILADRKELNKKKVAERKEQKKKKMKFIHTKSYVCLMGDIDCWKCEHARWICLFPINNMFPPFVSIALNFSCHSIFIELVLHYFRTKY